MPIDAIQAAKSQKWIDHALRHTVCDIGQLDHQTLLALNRSVRKGLLSKGKGGPFPKIKTIYAPAGFDFEADRERHIALAMFYAEWDRQAAIERKTDARRKAFKVIK